MWALAAFAAVFTLLFTVFLTNPAGLWDGLHDGLAYWLGQHGEGRGEKEWYFYLVVLFAEEWPALLLGAVGAVVALRRPTLLRLFLIWDFALSLAVYCWANERFTWLVLHPLLPLLLLAGLGVQSIWDARGALDRPARARRRRGRASALRGLRVVAGERRERRRPARVPRHHAVVAGGARRARRGLRASPTRAEREGRDAAASSSTPPRARRSRGRGTSATCRSATST